MGPWTVVILIGVATFMLRAVRLGVSWDIFVDEITYLRISQNVAQHLDVKLYGNAFYLHPPAFFFLEGAYIKLFPPTGDLVHQIYDVRYLNSALAAVTAVVLFGIGRRLAGWSVGIVAAAIFAIEPYIIKMNSRNYLDTAAMVWVALGYYVLFSAITEEKRRLPLWSCLAAGFLFGLGLLTKDMIAFATLLPLAVCFFMGWAMPRLQSMLVGVIALLTYVPYPVTIYAIGDWRDFSFQKFRGVSRLVGLIHETGFNQAGGPSFLGAVLANLREFATTYALLAAGGLSVIVLFFFFAGAAKRLLLAWTASTYALLAYIVVLGTLEEQFFYFLIIPSILATAATAKLVLEARALDVRVRRALTAATVLLVVAFLSWTGYVWAEIHSAPDNGYERVVAYLREVPEEYSVGVSNDTTQFVVKDLLVSDKIYGSVKELRADNVDYVVISSKLVEQGYGPSPEFYHWVKNNGKLAYGFVGRSFGLMGVYRLPDDYEQNGHDPQTSESGYGGRVGGMQSRSVEKEKEEMINVLLTAVLVVGIVTLAVALAVMVRTLWSSRRSEELGEGSYELLRGQHERLEVMREERQMLLEELKQESQKRQQFMELLEGAGPQLIGSLKQIREGDLENARRTEEQEWERLQLEERLQQLHEELERERQDHLDAQRRAEGLEQEHEQLAKIRQEAELLGQEHQRLTEELEQERGEHQVLQVRAENLQQERLQLEEELRRLAGELEQERQRHSEAQRGVEQLEQEGREHSVVEQQAAQDLQQLRVDFEREREERVEAQRRAEQLRQELRGLEGKVGRRKEGLGGGRSRARPWWRRPALVFGLLVGALAAWLTSLIVALTLLSP